MSLREVSDRAKGGIEVPCGFNSVDFAMCRALSRHEEATKGPVVSLTAEWEILPPSFGLITGFRHVNIRSASSRSKYVFTFRSIPLRSHQFVIKSRGGGSLSRQWKCVCDFYPLVLGCLRHIRYWNESPLCLFTILRLLKC
jgi:hypothetical protein